jgi:hypothetical protein
MRAAIDVNRLAGDEPAILADQEQAGGGDLVDDALPAERDADGGPSTDVPRAGRRTARRQHNRLTPRTLVVVLVLAGCTSSITYTSEPLYQPLLPSPIEFPPEAYSPTYVYAFVLQTSFTMQGGDTRRVTDQVEVSLQPSTNAEVDNLLACYDQKYNQIESVATGTNYYRPQGNIEQWNVSMLITTPAQAPEATYHWTSGSIQTPAKTPATKCVCCRPRPARRRTARGWR